MQFLYKASMTIYYLVPVIMGMGTRTQARRMLSKITSVSSSAVVWKLRRPDNSVSEASDNETSSMREVHDKTVVKIIANATKAKTRSQKKYMTLGIGIE